VAPVLKTDINGCGDPLRWPRDTLYSQKLALNSPTSEGRSVGIVRVRIKSHGVLVIMDVYAENWHFLDVLLFNKLDAVITMFSLLYATQTENERLSKKKKEK
jgi:hypothetical protein